MEKTFMVAMKDALKLPQEGTLDFGRQVNSLSNEDKLWYFEALKAAGIACLPPTLKAAG